jgi:hypothetical protein
VTLDEALQRVAPVFRRRHYHPGDLGPADLSGQFGDLLDLLREQEGDPRSILMVGHNPGLEDLIFDLVPDDGSSPLRDVVEEKFPTAAYAVLELDIDDWGRDRDEGCARLVHLMRPRDLDPALGPEPAADFRPAQSAIQPVSWRPGQGPRG